MWLAGVVTKTNREINDKMANVETAGLGPRKSLFVLVIIVGCFAVLWPRILFPLFSVSKDQIKPNNIDKSAGCCDLVFETDVNAIKIITEVCGNILKKNGEVLDPKTEQAFLSGKLTKEIIARCRQEVNMTCGMDIASFLNQNIRLGKTYKQILDEVRSYNMSNCLKMNYGVAPWTLGVPHLVGKFWMQGLDANSVRQERPPHLKSPPLHPALRERGRAIMGSSPGTRRTPSVPIIQNGPMEGRPMPIGGMRPPMGGAGGVVPPPKSSVGFLMPLYTLCIVVFFLYTVFKMLFRKQNEGGAFEPIKSNPEFRRKVFNEPSRSDRSTPETKLVVNAISGLVAEVRQQMEETHHNSHNNVNQETPPHPYTNGTVHSQRESSPIITNSKEYTSYRENIPPSWEATTPQSREDSFLPREQTPPPNENLPPSKEHIIILPELEKEGADTEDKLNEELEENDYEEEEIDIAEEEDEPVIEEKAIRNLRSSVEKEKATVKVLGMEMTAHREGGKPWAEAPRPHSPPALTTQPHYHHRHPTMMDEVSSIYLEGALPHQSRLLVAESETHREETMDELDDKDKPIVLSGKMTLSLINDESAKTTPERDNAVIDDSLLDLEDDEFTTASAATAPNQTAEDGNNEASEEEEEVEDEEVEVEKVEVKEVKKVEIEKNKVEEEVKEVEVEEEEVKEVKVEELNEIEINKEDEVEEEEEVEVKEVKDEKMKEVEVEEDDEEEEVVKEVTKVKEVEVEEDEGEEEEEVKEVKKVKEAEVEEDEEEEEVVKKVKEIEVEEDEEEEEEEEVKKVKEVEVEEDEEEEEVKEVKKVKEVEVEEDEVEEEEVKKVKEVEVEEDEEEEVKEVKKVKEVEVEEDDEEEKVKKVKEVEVEEDEEEEVKEVKKVKEVEVEEDEEEEEVEEVEIEEVEVEEVEEEEVEEEEEEEEEEDAKKRHNR